MNLPVERRPTINAHLTQTQALRLNEEKIRIVLNKADMIDTDQMMRVHGSLMWSLGRVFETPEVVRVYIRGVSMNILSR